MDNRKSTAAECAFAAAAVALLAGCASHRPPPQQFTADAPFSRTFSGSGDTVCWSVKRALLSQGYMLDRPNDAGVLTGSRDEQPEPKLNVTLRLQTSCADNRNGTSIVFVTATREDSRLQKMKQSTSMGVGPATLTMPSGSAEVLGTVRRVIAQRSRPATDSAGSAPAVESSLPSERMVQSAPPPDQRPVSAPPPAAQPVGGPNQ
jgi:hypothetical protein